MDREAGAFRVLRKPYSLLELEKAIGEVMAHALAAGEGKIVSLDSRKRRRP